MIPQAFTDLLAAGFQCLPAQPGATEPPALLADRRALLAQAVCAADQAGGSDWPTPALLLLCVARDALKARVPVIDRDTYRAATRTRWAQPAPPAPMGWQRRRDICDAIEEGL